MKSGRNTTPENASGTSERQATCERADTDLARTLQLLNAHVDNSPLAVIEFDPDFRVIRWAASAERIFGYSASETVGKPITELHFIHEDDIEGVVREFADLVAGRKVRGVYTNRNYRKDGSVIWCEWYTSAIRDSEGHPVSVLALALDISKRRRAQQEARRELENTRALLETARALSSGGSLADVLASVCDALLSTLPHARVSVSLWDEGRRAIVTTASKGRQAIPLGQVIRFEDLSSAGRHLIETRQPEVIDYDRVSPGPAGLVGRIPSHLALGVPLVYGDRLVGLVTIDDPEERRPFDDRDVEIAEGIASQASSAIEQARLLEAERERARLAETQSAVDMAIHASLEWEDIAAQSLSRAAEAIGAESASVVGQEDSEYLVWCDYGFSPSTRGMRVRQNAMLSEVADMIRRGTVAVDDTEGDERLAGILGSLGVKSMVVAPLVVRDEVIAALSFTYRTHTHQFTEAEVQFVTRVASGLSLALENARLYETERTLADRLQGAMLTLPDRLEGIEFAHAYHSAEQAARVGGDFYDLFEVGHDIVSITIGDVVGKGLAAAVLTSLAKNTIRAHATEVEKSPAEIFALANDVILKATPAESFVTVFFGCLDRRNGRLVYASAGHTTGVIVRDDGTTTPLGATGPILGALPDVEFGQAEVRLGPEDLLFLYTDGLTEARRGSEQYGEERVFDVVAGERAPLAAVRRVADDVLGFTGRHLSDDLALLALKRVQPEQPAPEAAGMEV